MRDLSPEELAYLTSQEEVEINIQGPAGWMVLGTGTFVEQSGTVVALLDLSTDNGKAVAGFIHTRELNIQIQDTAATGGEVEVIHLLRPGGKVAFCTGRPYTMPKGNPDELRKLCSECQKMVPPGQWAGGRRLG